MQYKIYLLASCSTNKKILKRSKSRPYFQFQDIKTEGILPEQLDEMKEKTGSYEALFSRNALKYRTMGLNNISLTEADYRRLILEEYTFLKRPVFWVGDSLFVGNAPKTIAALKAAIATHEAQNKAS
ncbi:MAG: arsenate reductase [Sphingobacteriales bacterium]|nr:arsenate reductase [Sphingobacteriales bacterium]